MIILHPSPARDYDKRRWDKWPELADRLVEKFGKVIFTGSEDDMGYVHDIIDRMEHWTAARNRCGIYDIVGLGKFLQGAELVVCVNTMTMHLAMALNVPTVAIIGGTPAAIVISEQQKNIRYVEDPALTNWDPHTAEYGQPRINEISVAQVMEKVVAITAGGNP